MRIRLKLMGMLKDKLPAELEVEDASTIADVLTALEVDPTSVQVFTVNGTLQRDQSFTLQENDELAIIPPVGGG